MSFVNGITNVFNSDYVYGGKVLKGEADCKDIEIKGKFVIIKTDHEDLKGKVLNNIYKAGAARRICDYVVISDEVVLICEMKSGRPGDKTQLKNGGRFIKYLLDMVKDHENVTFDVPPIKYVSFAYKFRNIKQATKLDKLSRIEWNNSELFILPCNETYHLKQFN